MTPGRHRVAGCAGLIALLVPAACDSRHDGWLIGHAAEAGGPSGMYGFIGGTVEVRSGAPTNRLVSPGFTEPVMPPHVVKVVDTADLGGYSLRLRAGTYTLVLRGTRCWSTVTVRVGATVRQDVVCAMK